MPAGGAHLLEDAREVELLDAALEVPEAAEVAELHPGGRRPLSELRTRMKNNE